MKFQFYILLCCYCFLIANCNKHNSKKAENAHPNILFIFTDDHAKNAMSIYNDKLIQTPNLDRIAREGIVFNRAFVTNSICGPSRAVILTGKYSHLNGFRQNGDRFDGSQQTFPKLLQQAGYHTAIVGKWHLGSAPTGFNYSNVLIGQGSYYNPTLIENGDTVNHVGYSTDIITHLALEHLESRNIDELNKENPFCLMVQYKAPHRNWMPHARYFDQFNEDLPLPFEFYDDYATRSPAAKEADMRIEDMFMSLDMKLYPEAYGVDTMSGGWKDFDPGKVWENHLNRLTTQQRTAWDSHYKKVTEYYLKNKDKWSKDELLEWKYQRYIKDYLRCVKAVDDNVGQILEYLEKNDLIENTLIVYSSDQGFYLGEHGWYDKRFMYEQSFGMPLAMRFPKKIKPVTVCNELVLNLDLGPTFLDVAGVDIPEDMQGKSLLPLFTQPKKDDWREAVYYHYYSNNSWHLVQRHEGVRTKNHKLINYYDQPAWELFDIERDPFEVNNIYANEAYKEIENVLKEKLEKLRNEFGLPGIGQENTQ